MRWGARAACPGAPADAPGPRDLPASRAPAADMDTHAHPRARLASPSHIGFQKHRGHSGRDRWTGRPTPSAPGQPPASAQRHEPGRSHNKYLSQALTAPCMIMYDVPVICNATLAFPTN